METVRGNFQGESVVLAIYIGVKDLLRHIVHKGSHGINEGPSTKVGICRCIILVDSKRGLDVEGHTRTNDKKD